MSTFKPASIGKTGILSIKKNGEQVSRYRPDLGDAEIDISSSEKTTTTGKFITINGGKLESCIVGIAPKQDLHGYNNPWVGGAGKNKLPLTVSGIKSANTSGTWSGNTYTLNTEVFKINTDTDGNVTSIDVTHVSSGATISLPLTLKAGTYHMSSGFSEDNGLNDTYLVANGTTIARGNTNSPGQVFTLSEETNVTWNLRVYNKSFIAYPMICLNSETDKTFEPYTNICGITGHSSVEVKTSGFNLWDEQWEYGKYDTTTGQKIVDANVKRSTNYIRVNPSTTCYLHTNISAIRIFRYDGNKNYIDNIVVNNDTEFATGNVYYLTFQCDKTMSYLCINVSDEDKNGQYVPYQGQDVTVSLGGTYYSGQVNLATGEMTIDKRYDDLGSFTWSQLTTSQTGKYRFCSGDLINVIKKPSTLQEIADVMCSQYGAVSGESPIVCIQGVGVHTNGNVIIYDSSKDTLSASDFKTAMSGVQLVYPLATPITIQLTPQQINTLIGENHLDTPLTGQSLTSAVYRELFAWDDVTDVVDNKAQYYEQNQYLGINLFDILEQGTIKSADGTPTDGTNRCRTNDYVDVIEGTRILINKPTTVQLALYRYDASKNYIDWFNYFWNNTEAVNYEYVIPSGTKYIKMAVAYVSGVDCVPSDFAGYTLLNVKSNAQLDITKQICKQFYGTCDSSADTVAKVVTVSSDQNFVLTTGCTIYVKFTNTNSASNITLDVNGSGAKSITYAGDTVVTGSSGVYTGTANYTNQYMYDGTYWKWMGYSNEKDTTYSSMSLDEMRAGTATSNRSIRADRLATVTEERIDAKVGKVLTVTKTLSTTDPTTYTFTDSSITADSTIDIYSSIFGVNPSDATVTAGSCTVTFPKYSSAVSMTCKIYVK